MNEKTIKELREELPEGIDLEDVYSWATDNDHPSREDIKEMTIEYGDDEYNDEYDDDSD